MTEFDRDNDFLLRRLSVYLNDAPRAVTPDMVRQMTADGTPKEEAFRLLLAALLGLDPADHPRDRTLYHRYFPDMVHLLDAAKFENDAYLRTVPVPERVSGRWRFRRQHYAPYEGFVCGDFRFADDGRVIPQIGFFDREFSYPAVLENGREWMLITPNEIVTMAPALQACTGRVLTYGLGLGYFAFHASEKETVTHVTVVEHDPTVIDLFRQYLLPHFPHRDKIELINMDAFDFAEKRAPSGHYDLIFTDLWHDAGDGTTLYLRMKALEPLCPESRFSYWIEPTLRYYLDE